MSTTWMAVQREDKCVQHDGIATNGTEAAEEDDDHSTTALLATTVECCQQLAEKLKQKEKSNWQQQIPIPNHSNFMPTSEERLLHQTAIEENIRLRALIQDVTDANKRWQKHNEKCQAYIENLKATIQELRDQLVHTNSSPSHTQYADSAAISRNITSDEMAALRLFNTELEESNRRLQGEVEEYKKKIVRYVSSLESAKSDHKEHVHLLEIQAEGHRADWEIERNEKKQLQKKLTKLQEDYLQAKAKIFRLQNPECCACRMRTEVFSEPILRTRHSSPVTYNIPPDNTLIPRSHVRHYIVCDGPDQEPNETERRVSRSRSLSPTPTTTATSFNCPDCGEHFPPERHVEFLEHYEHCQGKQQQQQREEQRVWQRPQPKLSTSHVQ